MSTVGQPERATQNRVVALFRDELGYSSELDHSAGGCDPDVLLQDRLAKGRERLDDALEAAALICEPVQPPKGELEHIHYFCGNVEIAAELAEHEPQRVRPDDWRGNQAKENVIKRALLPLLNHDAQEVERVFLIVKAQKEY